MNKEEITLKVKDSNNGFTILNDINYQTGKVIINEIEITDIETWNKAISKQLELQQENKQLKEKIESLKKNIHNIEFENNWALTGRDIAIDESKKIQRRIDKAIEYLENNSHKTEWGDLEQDNESIDINDDITDTEFIENLLEILRGM